MGIHVAAKDYLRNVEAQARMDKKQAEVSAPGPDPCSRGFLPPLLCPPQWYHARCRLKARRGLVRSVDARGCFLGEGFAWVEGCC